MERDEDRIGDERLARLVTLVGRASSRVAVEPPCVAHVRVRNRRGERDLLFGAASYVGPDVTVLDARTAPLATLLYDYEVGEDFEIAVDDRGVEGTLLERHLLEVRGGRLLAVHDAEGSSRVGEHGFRREARLCGVPSFPRAESRTGFGLEVQLDAEQRAAVDANADESMLVTGEAGAGKTTVALARLVRLARVVRPGTFRGVYVTPTEALARWVGAALERANVPGVEVVSFDALVTRLARRSFRRVPRRMATDAGAGTLRVKRHPALDRVLAELVDRRPVVRDDEDRAGEGVREDLLHLFGDRALLDLLVTSDAPLRPADLDEVIARTRAQFRTRTEDEFADVIDATRLDALDGRALDAGTPDESAGRIDVEDFAVLFELARLRAERRREVASLPESFDVLVLDEAQELAPIELRLLGRLVRDGGSVIVAGDEGQRTESGAYFDDFDEVLRELGVADARRVVLGVGYRCPPAIEAFARALRGRDAPLPIRDELCVRCFAFETHLVVWVAALVRRIRDVDSDASIAVIARDPATTLRIGIPLRDALSADLRIDGRFDFRRRFVVTSLAEVRGLEFDHVVLVDVDARTYPDDSLAERALYLGVTRACVSATLAWVGPSSPVLASRSGSPSAPVQK